MRDSNNSNRHTLASKQSILGLLILVGLAILGTTLLLLVRMTPQSAGPTTSSPMSWLRQRDWTPSHPQPKGQRWLSSNTIAASTNAEIQQRLQEFKRRQQQWYNDNGSTKESSSDQQPRQLISWGSAICSLVPDLFLFQLDPSTGMYVLVNNTNNNETDLAAWDQDSDNTTTRSDADLAEKPDEVSARLCWCTDYFASRPLEFCTEEYDTCAVPPDSRMPVSCYTTNTGDAFVRSFWPVALFWMIALMYACFCSESGRHARRYVRRAGICCNNRLCNAHERRTIEMDLNEMLQQEPERAAFMYRRYAYRQRMQQHRLEHRQQRRWYQWWQAHRPGRRSTENNNNNEADGTVLHVQGELVPEIENRPRLELKTKVFRSSSAEDEANPTNAQGATTAPAASGPTTTTENNNDNSESNANGWSLPQLHLPTFGTATTGPNARESTTLEEMDDEMEHGERCAICLLRLEDGDIVGDLPCRHVMHKVRRKNGFVRFCCCMHCNHWMLGGTIHVGSSVSVYEFL